MKMNERKLENELKLLRWNKTPIYCTTTVISPLLDNVLSNIYNALTKNREVKVG